MLDRSVVTASILLPSAEDEAKDRQTETLHVDDFAALRMQDRRPGSPLNPAALPRYVCRLAHLLLRVRICDAAATFDSIKPPKLAVMLEFMIDGKMSTNPACPNETASSANGCKLNKVRTTKRPTHLIRRSQVLLARKYFRDVTARTNASGCGPLLLADLLNPATDKVLPCVTNVHAEDARSCSPLNVGKA